MAGTAEMTARAETTRTTEMPEVRRKRQDATAVPGCGWAPGRPRSKRPKQKVARRRTGGTVVLGCLTLQL